MNHERSAVEKALTKYDLAAYKTAELALEVLSTTARMVAVDLDQEISYLANGYLITRAPAKSA
jgi:hypothetical protein